MPRRIPSKFFIKLRKSTTSIVSIKDFSDILNPIVVVNGEISKFKQEHEQNYQHPFEASTFKSSIMPLSSRDNFQRFPYSDVYFLKIGLIVFGCGLLLSSLIGILIMFIRKRKHNPLVQSASVTSTTSDSTIATIHQRNPHRQDSIQSLQQEMVEMQEIPLGKSPSRMTHIISNVNQGFNCKA